MNKFFQLAAVFLALGLLTACAEKWEKPGGTQQEFDAMQAACISRASSRFPPLMREVQIRNGYTTPITTNCSALGNSVNCYTTGGQYVPPLVIPVDDNDNARSQDVRSCFFENGWHPATDHKNETAASNVSSPPPAARTPCFDNMRCTDKGDGNITCSCP
jgi:hypothetical protein